jgi:hypothetical protein
MACPPRRVPFLQVLAAIAGFSIFGSLTAIAAEPTVGANNWTNTPGVVEGTITVRPVDTTTPMPPLGYVEYLPKGYNASDPATKWPLILFCSGAGEQGDGTNTAANNYQLYTCMTRHGPLFQVTQHKWDFPAVVVAVQQPGLWNNASIIGPELSYMQARYHIDPTRIYFTAICDGAQGLLRFISNNPGIATALLEIEAASDPDPGMAAQDTNVPIWGAHCYNDPEFARTSNIDWFDQITQADVGSSNLMANYPGYAGNVLHEAAETDATTGFPAERFGPVFTVTNCTVTNGSTYIAFDPDDETLGSAIFNTWGGSDAQPYALVHVGNVANYSQDTGNVVALGKQDGLYLTQPYPGASATGVSIAIQIPTGYHLTAYLDPGTATWNWQPGQVWDHTQEQKRIFTMFWYLDHTQGWVDTFNDGDCWNWLLTQQKTGTVVAENPPAITSSNTSQAAVGQLYTYQITASNAPQSFNATGLPAGLSVDTGSGIISGTPAATGTYAVTITASNPVGAATQKLALSVAPAGTILLSSSNAMGGVYNPTAEGATHGCGMGGGGAAGIILLFGAFWLCRRESAGQ